MTQYIFGHTPAVSDVCIIVPAIHPWGYNNISINVSIFWPLMRLLVRFFYLKMTSTLLHKNENNYDCRIGATNSQHLSDKLIFQVVFDGWKRWRKNALDLPVLHAETSIECDNWLSYILVQTSIKSKYMYVHNCLYYIKIKWMLWKCRLVSVST